MTSNDNQKRADRGFIRIIFILIILLVIINLLGLDAGRIWNGIFLPVFKFIGDLIIVVANFIVSLLRYAWAIFERG